MISLAVVEGKDDLCPNHGVGIILKAIGINRRERPVPLQEKIPEGKRWRLRSHLRVRIRCDLRAIDCHP